MLGADTERSEDSVRRGHPCRTLPEAETAAQKEVRGTVSRRSGIVLCRMNCLPARSHAENDNKLGALASAGFVQSSEHRGRFFLYNKIKPLATMRLLVDCVYNCTDLARVICADILTSDQLLLHLSCR